MMAASPGPDGPKHAIRGRDRKPLALLGNTPVSILVAGTVFITIATAFLALLWRGATLDSVQQAQGGLWRSLVVSGWATRTVTICAAVIRIAISAQLGIVMSMVGSLLLERHRVQLPDVAFFTIARAVNVGPISVLFGKGPALSRSSASSIGVVVTAAAIAVVSAFTSTILLSDFSDISVVGDSNTTTIRQGGERIGSSLDLWRSSFGGYPRFAEYTNDSEPLLVGPHIDDTGHTLRALLPIQASAERSILRSYTGTAPVFDTRFTCFTPNLTLVSLNLTSDAIGMGLITTKVAVEGNVTFQGDPYGVLQVYESPATPTFPFHCVLPYDGFDPTNSMNLSVCALPSLLPEITEPTILPTPPPSAYLVLNVTGPDQGWEQVNGIDSFIGKQGHRVISSTDTTTVSQGPWTTTKFVADDDAKGLTISITACVAALSGQHYYISATSPEDGPEPSFRDTISNARPYDTESVRRQLGATTTPLSLRERGIMALTGNLSAFHRRLNLMVPGVDLWYFLPSNNILSDCGESQPCASNHTTNPMALMTYGRGNAMQQQARSIGHPSHISLFGDTLETTGSPARALQAWFTTLTAQQYYDSLPRLTGSGKATCVYSVRVAAPSRWVGFAVVAVMLVVHVVLVAATTACFVRRTEHSFLGNSWSAVAQVMSDVTAPLLSRATELDDREVEKMIRSDEGGLRRRYGIARSQATGRTELALVDASDGRQ